MKLEKFPRSTLGFWPTPVVALDRLSDHLRGPRIYMKRDDQSGLALGGNKTRKLEFLFGDAMERGCDCVLTAGAGQSNHCRQTAAAAAALGLGCHVLLGGAEPAVAQGNLLLDRLLGAQVHWMGAHRKGEDVERVAEDLRGQGRRPYVIPYGGSNPRGALGFVRAAEELASQTEQAGLDIDHVVFASSSGGTHAGLLVGAMRCGADYELLGIRIDKEDTAGKPFAGEILDLACRTASLLELEVVIDEAMVQLDESVLGDGYGVVGDLEREAISLVARLEGIVLDPVYTGRAMAGLIRRVRAEQFDSQEHVLFWHTGGIPAVFTYADALQAPATAPAQ